MCVLFWFLLEFTGAEVMSVSVAFRHDGDANEKISQYMKMTKYFPQLWCKSGYSLNRAQAVSVSLSASSVCLRPPRPSILHHCAWAVLSTPCRL